MINNSIMIITGTGGIPPPILEDVKIKRKWS